MTDRQFARAGDGGIANAGVMHVRGDVNVGVRDEELHRKFDGLSHILRQNYNTKDVPDEMLESLTRSVGSTAVSADEALREIDRAIGIAKTNRSRRIRKLGRLLDDLASLNSTGRFNEAADLVEDAVSSAEAGEPDLADEEYSRLIDIAMDQLCLARDAAGVAEYFFRRAVRDQSNEASPEMIALEKVGQLLEETQRHGLPFDSEIALQLAQIAEDEAESNEEVALARLGQAKAKLSLGFSAEDPAQVDAAVADLMGAAESCRQTGLDDEFVKANAVIAAARVRIAEMRPNSSDIRGAIELFEFVLADGRLRSDKRAWGRAQVSYGTAIRILIRGTPQLGPAMLPKALNASEAAIRVLSPDDGIEWLQAQLLKANILSDAAILSPSPRAFTDAEGAYRTALEYLTPGNAPFGWAIANCALANLCFNAARYSRDPRQLAAAAEHCAEGRRVLSRIGSSVQLRQAEQLEAEISKVYRQL